MTLQLELQPEVNEEMASGLHGFISTRLCWHMSNVVEPQNLGFVFGDNVDYALEGLGTKIKKPDASFVSFDSLAELVDDVIPVAPTIAVEIISRTDGWKDTVDKALFYLQKGTKLVWVIDPYTKSIFVFTSTRGTDFETLKAINNAELSAEGVLKGFKLALPKLFELPKKAISSQ